MTIRIRDESKEIDASAIRRILLESFPAAEEADLVDRLRKSLSEQKEDFISLVAVEEESGALIGHVLLTPATKDGCPHRLMGLAPLAVAAAHRRKGIGGQLVRAALRRADAAGVAAVVVLGDPAYYGRFGFDCGDAAGLSCPYPAPEGAFRFRLRPGVSPDAIGSGLVRYHPAFDQLEGAG